MILDCLSWAPEIQMLFGLLGLLWYGTHYSSTVVVEKSLGTPAFNAPLSVKESLNLQKTEIESKAHSENPIKVFTGPVPIAQHLIFWGALWCLLSCYVVWAAPLQVVQFSGVFLRDGWTQHLSFGLFLFGAFCLAISSQWLKSAKNVHIEYSLLVLLALFGQHLLIMSTDLMSLYVSLELQSFCFVILCSLNYHSLYSIEAGMKYFLLSAFSSGLLLLGISFIYWTTGLTNCGHIGELLQTTDISSNAILLLGIWLVSSTLLWKLAAAPLHMWAADVYQGAWSSVTLAISTLPKLAILGFWIHQWHPIWSQTFGSLLLWFSGLSMLVGAVGAMSQVQIKRLLAFSSIGHMGILLMPLCTLQGSAGALLSHLSLYFLTSLITWGCLMWPFLRKGQHAPTTPQYLWDFSFLWKTSPACAWTWAIAMMSLAGLPPVAGFLGKLGIFWWSLNSHQYALLVTALASTLVSTVYYLRLIRIMYIDTPSQWSHFNKMHSLPAYIIAFVLILLSILLWYSSPLVLTTHLISLS